MKPIFVAIVIFISAFGVSAQWIKQTVETKASFRGLSVVSERVVWASGTGGTVVRTADGGKSWSVMTVPGAEKLDFRDIEAFDANTAYILSIGNGDASRIYKTTDSGKTWELQFTNKDE
ncbi:MAG TPA: glycosyl hydrolase, partial [Blastocatellia bacterium]|nr:glycosyl hydrolase [Blastocatellia bacterium]